MNARDIFELANELEGDFGNQRALDTLVLRQYLQTHVVETEIPDPKNANVVRPKPVGSGYAALVVNQDVSFLSGTPFLRINAPDAQHEKKAAMLEAALGGIWILSQGADPVWTRGIKDLALFGRCWWNIYPNPKAWAGINFDHEEDEPDEDYLERVASAKRDNFPIIWRYVESRNTWPTFKANGELDMVIEVRSMTRHQINSAYGAGSVSEDQKHRYGPRDTIKVIEFANSEKCQTVVAAAQPVTVYEFSHKMGVNPYVMAQMPPPPPNEHGYRWTGASFDLRYSVEEMDGRLADINYNIRKATRAQPVIKYDPEQRAMSPDMAGEPPKIDIAPDKPIALWNTEDISYLSPAQTNMDVYRFLEIVTGFARESSIRPVLSGALQSGQTGVLYNTAVQLAEKDFGPTLDNLKTAAQQIGVRFLRSVRMISEEFSDLDASDKIPIVYIGKKGESYRLELGAKDVRGYDNLIQARLSTGTPTNEQAQVAAARLATDPNNPLMSVETAMQRFLGIEDPIAELERINIGSMVRRIMEKLGDVAAERALGLVQSAPPDDALMQRIGALSPAAQQAVQAHASSLGQNLNGGGQVARSAANSVRTGVQTPSQTEATRMQTYS